jgi:hypothetical protein
MLNDVVEIDTFVRFSNSKFKILTGDLALSRSCECARVALLWREGLALHGLQSNSVTSIKTTRQLSKIDPYVGGLEGGVTPSNRGLGGDPPSIRFAKYNQPQI